MRVRKGLLVLGVLLLGGAAGGLAVTAALQPDLLQGLFGPRPVTYEVVRGDTLFVIARDHGVTVDDLRAWNGIEGDRIEVGQILRIHVAEAPAEAAPTRRRASGRTARGGAATSGTADAAPLVMPPEKPCLAGPALDDLQAEEGAVASAGLSYAEVDAAMDAFVGRTLRCVPEGSAPEGRLHAAVTVACTGRVARVEVVDAGGLPPEMVSCVRETLGYVPFPAHDMPDGYTFEYPLTFAF